MLFTFHEREGNLYYFCYETETFHNKINTFFNESHCLNFLILSKMVPIFSLCLTRLILYFQRIYMVNIMLKCRLFSLSIIFNVQISPKSSQFQQQKILEIRCIKADINNNIVAPQVMFNDFEIQCILDTATGPDLGIFERIFQLS